MSAIRDWFDELEQAVAQNDPKRAQAAEQVIRARYEELGRIIDWMDPDGSLLIAYESRTPPSTEETAKA